MIGRIYKITCTQGNETYIGSTTQNLDSRLYHHIYDYKNRQNLTTKSGDIFNKYGVEACEIILIKEYEICDRKHLLAYEQLWINKLENNNKNDAFTIPYIQKIKLKNYRVENREYFKNYRIENEEYFKDYRKTNADKLRAYLKVYKSQSMTCECGAVILRGSKYSHIKSKKHNTLLKLNK